MRTVYLASARNDQPTATHARWLVGLGAQVRTVAILPLRMLVVDRALVVVPIDPANTAAGALVLRGCGVAATAGALFDRTWSAAAPLGVGSGRALPALRDQERAVLQMLLNGDTDEQTARQLGVSTRTVGRMAADLLVRLGARSRFQAGALAAARGWITEATMESVSETDDVAGPDADTGRPGAIDMLEDPHPTNRRAMWLSGFGQGRSRTAV